MPVKHPIRVGLCGEFQVGKSLLINCLLGENVALVGDLLATTPFPVAYQWAEQRGVELLLPEGVIHPRKFTIEEFVDHLRAEHQEPTGQGQVRLRQFAEARVSLPCPRLRQITLVDTPGVNAVTAAGIVVETDEMKAHAAISTLHCAVLVKKNDKEIGPPELAILGKLAAAKIPFVIVMNCHHATEWSPAGKDNRRLVRESGSKIHPLVQKWMLPAWRGSGDDANGSGAPKSSSPLEYSILPLNAAWHRVAEGAVPTDKKEADWPKKIANTDEFDGQLPSSERLRELSRVPELQRFLLHEPERSVGVNAYCLGTLHRATAQWSQAAVQQIQQLKKTVAG